MRFGRGDRLAGLSIDGPGFYRFLSSSGSATINQRRRNECLDVSGLAVPSGSRFCPAGTVFHERGSKGNSIDKIFQDVR